MDERHSVIQGQLQGVEMALQAVIAMVLAGRVKSEADFSKMADLAADIHKRLIGQVEAIRAQAVAAGLPDDVSAPMLAAMSGALDRCFQNPEALMRQSGDIVLELTDPPSEAKN